MKLNTSRCQTIVWSAAFLFAAGFCPSVARAQDAAALTAAQAPEGAIWLDTLDIGKMTSGWEGFPAKVGKSIEGRPLTLKGVVYPHGVGTHARSDMVILTNGSVQKFVAMVGVDDEKPDRGSVVFMV